MSPLLPKMYDLMEVMEQAFCINDEVMEVMMK